MSVRQLIKAGVIVAISAAMFGCGGGGGGGVSPTPTPTKTVSGAGLKDYMVGSTVVIYDATGKEVGRGTTGDYGKFSIEIPQDSKGPYLVVITGGQLDKDGIPGGNDTQDATNIVLSAPVPKEAVETEKAVAVTPITTAVVMESANVNNPQDLIDKIQDVAESVANKTEEIIKTLNALPVPVYVPIEDNTTIDVVENAISGLVEAVNSTAFENGTFNPEMFTEIVSKIQEDIKDGKLDGKENGTMIYENATAIEDIVQQIPSIKAVSLTLGGKTDSDLTDGLQIENASESNKELVIVLDVSKGAYGKSYPVKAVFSARGVGDDKRSITATLDNVTISVDNETGDIRVTVPENATVEISGTNSLGHKVVGTLKNLKGPDIIKSVGNKIIYDLSIIENKLKSINATDPLHDLADVVIAGYTYEVTADLQGLPGFFPITGTVSVVTNAPPRFEWGSLDNLKETYYTGDKIKVSGAYAEDPEGVGIESCKLWIYYPDGNKNWVDTHMENGTCEVVLYTIQLDTPGTYKFVFEATDEDGVSNSETKEFQVVEWPPVPSNYYQANAAVEQNDNRIWKYQNENGEVAVKITLNSGSDTKLFDVYLPNATDCSIDINHIDDFASVNVTGVGTIEAYVGTNGGSGCMLGKEFYIANETDLYKFKVVNATSIQQEKHLTR